MMMPMWWGGGWGSGWGVVGMVFMFLFWILIIVGVVLLIRWLLLEARGGGQGRGEGETALEILKKRYARGEVNKEEFEAKRRDLLLIVLLVSGLLW